jgi:uncharacterized protein (UPF0262 family)
MTTSPHIHTLTLDGNIRYSDPAILQEREMAVTDLLRENVFILKNADLSSPYALHLSAAEQRLLMEITSQQSSDSLKLQISLHPFRRLIKDYFLIWESYAEAIRNATPERLEAIDMGRRGLHNEGAELLIKQLEQSVEIDFDTARRLFTLLCVLHIK